MKKLIILFVTLFLAQGRVDAQTINSLYIHNSCATAAKVCSNTVRITTPSSFRADCEDTLVPQFFKFDMSGPGAISLNTFTHTGTYTLYGPLSSLGLASCQQISLGQVNQVTGNLSGLIPIAHGAGYYVLRVDPTNCIGAGESFKVDIIVGTKNAICRPSEPECKDCIGTFSPQPGRYRLSAWVKGDPSQRNTSYDGPMITVGFSGSSDSSNFLASGNVIDDWQRIDEIVTVPSSATAIRIGLHCNSGTCLFDDIRFTPIDGSMVSYVYDPVTLLLVAKLDERNYATMFEYDEQGKLIRTKKETEKGIMTISESRDNIYKQ